MEDVFGHRLGDAQAIAGRHNHPDKPFCIGMLEMQQDIENQSPSSLIVLNLAHIDHTLFRWHAIQSPMPFDERCAFFRAVSQWQRHRQVT